MHTSLWTVLLVVSLVFVASCKGSKSTSTGSVGAQPSGKDSASLEISEYSGTLTGRVVYSGPPEEQKVRQKQPDNNQEACPKTIPQEGWYTSGSADGKGVRYAVVFLRPLGGTWKNVDKQLLALRGGTQAKPGAELVEVYQPKCQFEPRVSLLFPGQKLRGHNNSNPPISHDFMLQASNERYGGSIPPGSHTDLTLPGDDRRPYTISCSMHANYMNGYVWSFTHPFAAVTNDNGEFTINNVPVLAQGKMELVVWHEMLKTERSLKVVGEVSVGSKEVKKQNVELP